MVSVVAPASVDSFYQKHKDTLVPVDASWYMPNVPVNGYHEFMKKRLSDRAVFFDVEKIKDFSSKYPHMLPTKEEFANAISELGIKNDSTLLFYDQHGIFSLCRAVWMFEIFGHDPNKLFILNTFPSYNKGHSDPNLVLKINGCKTLVVDKLVTSPSPFPPSDYKATFDPKKVITFEKLLELVKEDKIGSEYTLIDARSEERFSGAAPEVRQGLSSGHIKNAINIPFTETLTPDKAFLSSMSLKNLFERHGIDESKPIIVSCGSGITACVIRCALELAGFDRENIAVYDGSWTEWAKRAPAEFIVKDV